MEMRPFTLLPAMVLAVLLMGGPVLGHDSASADRIEGVWNVEVTILSACGPTGVPVATFRPGTTLAPPPPILRGSPGLGTWQHLGGRRYTAVFTFFRLNRTTRSPE